MLPMYFSVITCSNKFMNASQTINIKVYKKHHPSRTVRLTHHVQRSVSLDSGVEVGVPCLLLRFALKIEYDGSMYMLVQSLATVNCLAFLVSSGGWVVLHTRNVEVKNNGRHTSCRFVLSSPTPPHYTTRILTT